MNAACLQCTKAIRECCDTDNRFDALKLMEYNEIPLLWVETWCMIEIARPVAPFAKLIKIYITSFGLDFFVYAVMRSRMFTLH